MLAFLAATLGAAGAMMAVEVVVGAVRGGELYIELLVLASFLLGGAAWAAQGL